MAITILDYLKRLMGINQHQSKSWYEIEREIEEKKNILLQELENSKIERGIKLEALRWFREWEDAPTLKVRDKEFKNCIHIVKPFITCIMLYDEKTAKYKGCDIHKLVQEEYNRLKNNKTKCE